MAKGTRVTQQEKVWRFYNQLGSYTKVAKEDEPQPRYRFPLCS